MRLTKRCMDVLRLLRGTRWLTTGRIRQRFFPKATPSAARRRLRILARAGYLRKHQENRMREAMFALGPEGKRVLEREGPVAIRLERRPPEQLDHMLGIADIRIAAEMAGEVSFFFAAWELPGIGWKQPIVPDAVFRLMDRTFAAEFDCGTEGIQFFSRTKGAAYRRGLAGLPLAAVLVVADRQARMEALMRAIADDRDQFRFTTIDAVRKHGILAPIFHRKPGEAAAPLMDNCCPEVFRRGDSFAAARSVSSENCKNPRVPS